MRLLARSQARRAAVLGGANLGRYCRAILADSPLAYWRLGEASGPALDATGRYTAAANGSPTYSQPSLQDWDTANKAVSLTGTSAFFSQATVKSILGGRTTASMEAWISRASASNHVQLGFRVSSSYYFYFDWSTDGKLYLCTTNASGNSFPSCVLAGTGAHHVVGVFNGGLSGLARAQIYVDGVAMAMTGFAFDPPTALPSAANLGDFHIGYVDASSDGVYDEVALYAAALTQAQVTRHWTAAVGAA